MRYISHGTGGNADCLTLGTCTKPEPGPGQILIEVVAAGVNRPDLLQRAGLYAPPPDASPILGLEVAGRVAALGSGVTRWKTGDAVTALAPGGGYAEYCAVPADHALPLPTGMDFLSAAGLPETWFTVWSNLINSAKLKAGESLLVHGGSSGIGLTAIQLAKHVGAEIFVTVGNSEKAAFCQAFGAAHAINYRELDFVAEVTRLSAGQGVDVVLDMVGAPYFQKNLSLLRTDGRHVSIAYLEGGRGEFDLRPIMMKRLVVTGSTLRPKSIGQKAAIRDALAANIWPRLAAGDLLPHIDRVFPLADAAEAHRHMESGKHIGKIVLKVR